MAPLLSYPPPVAELVGEVDAAEEVGADSGERLDLSLELVLSHQVQLQRRRRRRQNKNTR